MDDARTYILEQAAATLTQMIGPELTSKLWVSVIDCAGPDGGTVETHLQVDGPVDVWQEAYPLLVDQSLPGPMWNFWPDPPWGDDA